MMKSFLFNLREDFFAQKYRFDLGMQFMAFINFALLIVASSDKLKIWTGIDDTRTLILLAVPGAFVLVWLLGFILDVLVKYQYMQETVAVKRSPLWNKVFDGIEQLDEKMNEMYKKLDSMEKNK